MTGPSSPAVLDALVEAVGLKDVMRRGWVRRGVDGPEDVAAHSWGVAFLVLVLCPPDLDLATCLAFAVLHDLAEVRVGDLTPHDGVSRADKAAMEARALDALAAPLPDRVRALWHTYEARDRPEARFVRQLDRLDMALTAVAYAEQGRLDTPHEFLDSAAAVIDDPALRVLLDGLRDRLRRVPTPPAAG